MKKAILAGVAAVAIIGSTAVYAQHRHHHHRMSMEDRAAFVDAKIASVKAGLQLTPDQEKLWPPVEAAVRDFAKQRMAQANARASERDARRAERDQKGTQDGKPSAPDQTRDPVARLRERADRMAETAAGLKKIADAADPLYKTLNDGQKRRLAVLTRMGGHHGWRGRGFERGLDGDRFDRDRRPDRDRGAGGSERL
ncbi:MAG: Spy/CpxP family protein refolding chaperone [Afipia sp.]|nr:Spy/CpxP family protein refolding chaperone [Afipia sp.]MBS4005038.1 Spy/CpxP family protein refolding chaperone [Afipia sp.]